MTEAKDAARVLFLHKRRHWARHFPGDFCRVGGAPLAVSGLRFKRVMRNYVRYRGRQTGHDVCHEALRLFACMAKSVC